MALTGNQSFSYSKTNYDSFTGKVGPNTASSAVGLEQTTTGSGSAGTMTQISQGQFNYNGRQTSYGYPTPTPTTSPVTLAGPNLPFLNNATYNGSNWQRLPRQRTMDASEIAYVAQ